MSFRKELKMAKPFSVSSRLLILVVLAIIFAATMIGLSIKSRSTEYKETYFGDSDKMVEKTFPVQSNGNLIIDADVGNVSIIGSEVNEVSVRVIARGSDEQLRRFDVTFDQEGNTVKVKGKTKHSRFRFFNNNWLDIQFEIQVPKSFNLNLNTSGGNIEIQNMKGQINGETSGGNLDITDIEGNVKLSTSGGNVDVRKAKGEFDLETSGGNMYAESVDGSLRMETSGGNIEIRGSTGKVNASTSGGNIRASLKDNQGIDLSTSGGNISVELPKTISADVRAEASGGDVSCDIEYSGKIKDGSMKGKINGGGNLIRLETSGGDIVITSNE